MLERRRQIVGTFDAALKDLPVAVLKHYGKDFAGSGHLYLTRLLGRTDAERRDVIVKMAERGIACNVHYKPLPMMTAYKALGFDIKDFLNACRLFENEVTLPLHTRLGDEDVRHIYRLRGSILPRSVYYKRYKEGGFILTRSDTYACSKRRRRS